MLVDDEFLAGCNINEPLRGDGVETASASVTESTVLGLWREEGNHCKVIVGALAYALVCTQRPFVKL